MKSIETSDNVSNNTSSANLDKEDLGDIVRDDNVKSVHLGNDVNMKANGKANGEQIRNENIKYVSPVHFMCILCSTLVEGPLWNFYSQTLLLLSFD